MRQQVIFEDLGIQSYQPTWDYQEQLLKEMTTTYIGFDPTSDSLHIGSLVPIILLKER